MAVTQGIIDAFVVIAALTAVTLIIIVTRRPRLPDRFPHIATSRGAHDRRFYFP